MALQNDIIHSYMHVSSPDVTAKDGTVQNKVVTTRKDKTGTLAIAKPEQS